MKTATQWLLPATAGLFRAAALVLMLIAPSGATAQDGKMIKLDEILVVCGSYSEMRKLYALAINNQSQYQRECWQIEPPTEVIVLQKGALISSVTYRQFRGEDHIARFIANGAKEDHIKRIRENPWTKWYLSPAWTLTGWLKP